MKITEMIFNQGMQIAKRADRISMMLSDVHPASGDVPLGTAKPQYVPDGYLPVSVLRTRKVKFAQMVFLCFAPLGGDRRGKEMAEPQPRILVATNYDSRNGGAAEDA